MLGRSIGCVAALLFTTYGFSGEIFTFGDLKYDYQQCANQSLLPNRQKIENDHCVNNIYEMIQAGSLEWISYPSGPESERIYSSSVTINQSSNPLLKAFLSSLGGLFKSKSTAMINISEELDDFSSFQTSSHQYTGISFHSTKKYIATNSGDDNFVTETIRFTLSVPQCDLDLIFSFVHLEESGQSDIADEFAYFSNAKNLLPDSLNNICSDYNIKDPVSEIELKLEDYVFDHSGNVYVMMSAIFPGNAK